MSAILLSRTRAARREKNIKITAVMNVKPKLLAQVRVRIHLEHNVRTEQAYVGGANWESGGSCPTLAKLSRLLARPADGTI